MDKQHFLSLYGYYSLLVLLLFCNLGLRSQTCLSGFTNLTYQTEIDNFAANNPGCTEILGTLRISDPLLGPSITNLGGLSQVTRIRGNLEIDGATALTDLSGLSIEQIDGVLLIKSNESLTNLTGLESLTEVGGVIIINGNQDLASITALGNIADFGTGSFENYSTSQLPAQQYSKGTIFIESNASLTNLNGLNMQIVPGFFTVEGNSSLLDFSGLENLISVGEGIVIQSNLLLASFDGLENLTQIGGLEVASNNALQNMSALQNVTSVLDFLRIANNLVLTSLIGLDHVDLSGIIGATAGEFVIYNNPALDMCTIESLCSAIAGCSGCFIAISSNGTTCENSVVISDQCNANFIAASGSWSNVSNWGNGYLPQAGTSVLVEDGNTVTIENGTVVEAKCLSLGDGAKLTVNGEIELTGGEPVTLSDGSMGTAMICGTGTIDGDLIPTAGILVSPGNSPGTLNIDGNWQDMGSVLRIEISGVDAGSSYDQVKVSGQYNIGASSQLHLHFNFLPSVTDVFQIVLADAVLGTFAPENIIVTGLIYNSVTVSYPGGNVVEANIDAIALPVEFLYFQAVESNVGILLKWATATEEQNKGFEIQRSQNGRVWETIDFTPGQGESEEKREYQWVDQRPVRGLNYYRLKQLDFDGEFEYSKIVTAKWALSRELDHLVTFSPNPARSYLRMRNHSLENLELMVYQGDGRLIQDFTMEPGEERELSTIEWPKGLVLLKFKASTFSSLKRLICL